MSLALFTLGAMTTRPPQPAMPYHPPAPESLVDAMTRDLEAWRLAQAAISRARRG